jgi:hypothetical protein
MFYWGNNKPIYRLIKQLRKMDMRTIHPIAFKSIIVRKEEDNMTLVYNVTAGPVVDNDVVERRLTVTVNGEVSQVTTNSNDTTSFGEFSFADNDNVVLTLVDVDDAGNVSSPAVVEFIAADTIPPAKPGELGVSLVREE